MHLSPAEISQPSGLGVVGVGYLQLFTQQVPQQSGKASQSERQLNWVLRDEQEFARRRGSEGSWSGLSHGPTQTLKPSGFFVTFLFAHLLLVLVFSVRPKTVHLPVWPREAKTLDKKL